MNKKIIALLLSIFVSINVQSHIEKKTAIELVKTQLRIDSVSNVNMYVSKTLIPPKTQFATLFGTKTSPDFYSWLIFIDDYPFANWSHACRYIYVDSQNSNVIIYNDSIPPLLDNMEIIIETRIKNEVITQIKKQIVTPSRANNRDISKAKHNYAVIISGGGNKDYNYERYWNDCALIYSTLINKYNYCKEQIYVIMADGTNPAVDRHLLNGKFDSSPLDLDNDGEPDIRYAATRTSISTVFNELSLKLNTSNDLFIYTTDHGALINNHSYISLWNGECISDSEFAKEVNKVNANIVNVVMEQCHSGGFVNQLQAENRIIATACLQEEPSWASSNGYYNEFVYHWTSSIAGKYPNGQLINADTDGNGKVSMLEAFNYASEHDTMNETPQYSSTPLALGEHSYMSRDLKIMGYGIVCDSSIYYVDNLPSECRVEWKDPGYSIPHPILHQDSPVANMCTITNAYNYPDEYVLSAIIYYNDTPIDTLRKNIIAVSNVFYGTYTQETCNSSGVQHPAIHTTKIKLDEPMFVHQGCTVILNSGNFVGMKVTHSGVTPSSFYFDGKRHVAFSLPLKSGGIPFYVEVSGEGTCNNYRLLFFSVANNGNIAYSKINMRLLDKNIHEISINPLENTLKISDKKEIKQIWNINIYNTKTGRLMHTEKGNYGDYTIDTNNWERGVYIVRVNSGEDVFTEKISVE